MMSYFEVIFSKVKLVIWYSGSIIGVTLNIVSVSSHFLSIVRESRRHSWVGSLTLSKRYVSSYFVKKIV